MEYNVKFIHPTTGATMEAAIDPNLTAAEVITALEQENFIEPAHGDMHYILGVNGGDKVEGSQTLASGGLREGGTINVVRSGSAG